MSISPIRPLAAAVTALVLGSSVLSRPALVQAQEGIGIKAGDTVNVATGQGMVLAIVRGAGPPLQRAHHQRARGLRRYPTELRRRGSPPPTIAQRHL
jgi:hypothetical protein